MVVEKIFLGPAADPGKTIAEKLLETVPVETPSADFSEILMILPGKQAVRSVSGVLAAGKSVVLPPELMTAGVFLRTVSSSLVPAASPAEEKAVFMELLTKTDPESCPFLFPQGLLKTPEVLSWHADQFLKLRRELELAPKYNTVRKLSSLFGDEDERWKEYARLEETFAAMLKEKGVRDPADVLESAMAETDFFLKYRQIILAASPDLSPCVKEKLNHLKADFALAEEFGASVPRFSVFILADTDEASLFDEWGCVIPDAWKERAVPFQAESGWIHSVQGPEEMARLASLLAVDPASGKADFSSTAVVITDPALFPVMEERFSSLPAGQETLSVYDPGGIPMGKLRLIPLISALRSLIHGETLSSGALKELLHQEDMLAFMAEKASLSTDELLQALDEFMLTRLPDEITEGNLPDSLFGERFYFRNMDKLRNVLLGIMAIRNKLKSSEKPFSVLRSLFSKIYSAENIPLVRGISIDSEAEKFNVLAEEFGKSTILSALKTEEMLSLFEESLSRERLYPEHADEALEITGFLDMPFHPAAKVILCGMNEGQLPESWAPTPFLNDALRTKAGLPDNSTRFARDSFYLSCLLKRTKGNVHFIACKTDSDGGPLRFSTLFFSGVKDTETLLKRASVLSGNYPLNETSGKQAKELPFQMKADLTGAFCKDGVITLSVTDFKQLLASPLRAFLDRVKKMQITDFSMPELDAKVLGTIIHAALEKLPVPEEWIADMRSGNGPLGETILNKAEESLYRTFLSILKERTGDPLPLLPMIQAEQMRLRMKKTLRELFLHTGTVLEKEWKLGGGHGILFHDALIKGVIDRIEYRPEENTLYLVDFKTGENADDPEKAHYKSKRFLDLQLPLYRLLLKTDSFFRERHPEIMEKAPRIRCGYFAVSSIISETGYHFWEDIDRYDACAEETAVCVIELVRSMQKGKLPEDLLHAPQYDNYRELFPWGMADTFTGFTLLSPVVLPQLQTKAKETKKRGTKKS